MERAQGSVKWFSQEKGFGFVTRDDGSDVFVHHTGISGRGFKTLEQGERVEFEVIEEPKGLKAANLVRLDAPAGGGGDGFGAPGTGGDDGYGRGYGGGSDDAGNSGYGGSPDGGGSGRQGGRRDRPGRHEFPEESDW